MTGCSLGVLESISICSQHEIQLHACSEAVEVTGNQVHQCWQFETLLCDLKKFVICSVSHAYFFCCGSNCTLQRSITWSFELNVSETKRSYWKLHFDRHGYARKLERPIV